MRDAMSNIDRRLDNILFTLLEEPIDNATDSVWDVQSKQFYQRCMDEGAGLIFH
jgi:hypothetical protein